MPPPPPGIGRRAIGEPLTFPFLSSFSLSHISLSLLSSSSVLTRSPFFLPFLNLSAFHFPPPPPQSQTTPTHTFKQTPLHSLSLVLSRQSDEEKDRDKVPPPSPQLVQSTGHPDIRHRLHTAGRRGDPSIVRFLAI